MAARKSRIGIFFKRGLRALLPTVLTIGVILIVVNFFSKNIVGPVNASIKGLLIETGPGQAVLDSVFSIDVESEAYAHESGRDSGKTDWELVKKDLDDRYPSFFGVIMSLALVYISGFILATFVGKRVLSRFEIAMGKFPVVKIIYPYARQVVEFFMREKAVQFNSVVAVEYPRKGVFAIGFVTGLGMKRLNEIRGREYINVFMPTSPTPVTGYVTFVPAEDLIALPITVDEAVRFLISGGVLIPESQRNPDSVLEKFQQITAPSVMSPEDDLPPDGDEEPQEDS